MKVKLESFLQEVSEKTTENNQYPVLTSSKAGLYLQSDYFNKQVASKDNTGYKIIKRGQFTYRAMSDTGEFFPNMLDCADIGIVSPAYPVFEIAKPIIIPDFLKYYFKSNEFQQSIASFAQGSTRTSIKYGKLKTVLMELPDLKEQQKYIEILDTAQKIINDRKRELEKLDELIKARFVEMFGNLRMNTKGWSVKTFDKLSYLITDGEHSTPRRITQGVYLLSARNILNHSLQLEDVDYIDKEEYERIAKRVVPQEGDVLISCSGTVGRCCSVPAGVKFQMVRSVALIRFKEEINHVFAEYMITSDYLQEQIKGSQTVSAQANLFQGKIKALKGFVPPIELQKQFADFVNQVDKSKVIDTNIIPEGGFYYGNKFFIS